MLAGKGTLNVPTFGALIPLASPDTRRPICLSFAGLHFMS